MDKVLNPDITVRAAILEDWPALQDAYKEFLKSRYTDRFDLNFENFRKFFQMSLYNKAVCVVLTLVKNKIVGLTVIYELGIPFVDMLLKRTHIHIAAWIPEYFNIPLRIGRECGDRTMKFIDWWAVSRGHDGITANTRVPEPGKNNYKFKGVNKRYGFAPAYVSIFKPLKPMEQILKEENENGQR